jgi:hypothetical protein
MGHFSNSDIPIPPHQLAQPLERWPGYDPFDEELLPFMIESQGVCVWAVRLDAGDDPPVVVEVDSGTPPRWRRCADRFSCWLKCQVLDRTLWQSSWFFAQAAPMSPEVLSRLRRCFEEGSQTYGWPGETNYRFYNADRASFCGMETSSATGRSSRHPLSWQLRRLTKSRKLRGSRTNSMGSRTSMSRRCGSGELSPARRRLSGLDG